MPVLLLLILLIVGSVAGYALGRYRADVVMTDRFSTRTQLAEGFRLQTLRTGTGVAAEAEEAKDAYLLPGTGLALQLSVEGKTEIPAYLYVEVTGSLRPEALTDDWRLLEQVTGKHGGAVYAYRSLLQGAERDLTVQILRDDLRPRDDPEAEDAPLSFCGYLLQLTSEPSRGADQARTVFVNRFPQD